MKIAFYTLGCKVNQFETQAMEIICTRRGHEIVEFSENADAYVLNTCTVTAVSDKKSRQALRRTRRLHPQAVIAVCGCFPQVDTDSARELECADVIGGSSEREKLIDMIENAFSNKQKSEFVDVALKRRDYEVLPAGGLMGHTRAMLKVQDGCSNFCSYCIIPYARGPVRSMALESAVQQVRELREQGYHEIVITGIEISSYGRDLKPRITLVDLLCRLLDEAPDVRFRLGSLEPRTVDLQFCERLSGYKNLCPQFHLSLQSGCDATLARMKRKYDSARYLQSVELLNEYFPGCAVTTDLIVGFPGEDEGEFLQTLEFIKKCRFSDLHIFPYSKRRGTPAAEMPEQVLKSVKEERAKRASAVAAYLKAEYLHGCIGKTLKVLFEEKSDGAWTGHGENYVRVYANSGEDMKNRVHNVKITSLHKDGLLGELV